MPHLAVTDAPVSEPEAIAVARALALAAGTAEAHATEVARLATLTAERMALPAGVVLRCGLGGWLHGADERIVRGVPTLREAAAAIRHRHERYDGTGGPDGLAGAAIPIEARIVAAADAYAALTGTPAGERRRAARERRARTWTRASSARCSTCSPRRPGARCASPDA